MKHFEKYGEITDSVVMRDRKTGKPRGFGFITYADPSVVDRVIEDDHIFSGKQVSLGFPSFRWRSNVLSSIHCRVFQVEIKRTIPREAIPGARDFKTRKIFVGGIPTSVTEGEVLVEGFLLS